MPRSVTDSVFSVLIVEAYHSKAHSNFATALGRAASTRVAVAKAPDERADVVVEAGVFARAVAILGREHLVPEWVVDGETALAFQVGCACAQRGAAGDQDVAINHPVHCLKHGLVEAPLQVFRAEDVELVELAQCGRERERLLKCLACPGEAAHNAAG